MRATNLEKEKKTLKAQLETKIKDFRRLQEDYSNKFENYDYVVKQNAELVDEIESLKGKFETAKLDVRKYDFSSEVVANMIDHSMQFKKNQSKGLGYNHVPPPFNHSYVSKPLSKEEIVNESFMIYGKPSGFVSGGFINVESTNISTSPTDQSLNQLKHEVEGYVSENKIESKLEAFILNKDNSFSNVLSVGF